MLGRQFFNQISVSRLAAMNENKWLCFTRLGGGDL